MYPLPFLCSSQLNNNGKNSKRNIDEKERFDVKLIGVPHKKDVRRMP